MLNLTNRARVRMVGAASALLLAAFFAADGWAQIRPRPGEAPVQANLINPESVLKLLEAYYGPNLTSYSETFNYSLNGVPLNTMELLIRRVGADPKKQPPAILLHVVKGEVEGGVKLVYWQGQIVFATAEDPKDHKVNLPPERLNELFDGQVDPNLTRRLAAFPHLPFVIFGNLREAILAGHPRLSAYPYQQTPGYVCLREDYPDGTATTYIVKSDTGQIRQIIRNTPAGTAWVDITKPLPGRDPFLQDELFTAPLSGAVAKPMPTPNPRHTPSLTPGPNDTPVPGQPTPGGAEAAGTPVPSFVGGTFQSDHPLLNKLAPDFSYPTAQAFKGQLFDHLGRLVILVFWDAGFFKTDELLAGLKKFADRQPRGSVVIFAINTRQEKSAALDLLAKLNDPRVIVIMDARQEKDSLRARFSVTHVPTVFILDSTLNVRAVYEGWREDSLKALTEAATKCLPKAAATQP